MQASPSLILRSALRRKKREAKAEGRPGRRDAEKWINIEPFPPRLHPPLVSPAAGLASFCPTSSYYAVSLPPSLVSHIVRPCPQASAQASEPLLTARPRRRFGRDSKFVQLATASTSPRVNIWGKLQDCVTAILATLPLSLSLSLFLSCATARERERKSSSQRNGWDDRPTRRRQREGTNCANYSIVKFRKRRNLGTFYGRRG